MHALRLAALLVDVKSVHAYTSRTYIATNAASVEKDARECIRLLAEIISEARYAQGDTNPTLIIRHVGKALEQTAVTHSTEVFKR